MMHGLQQSGNKIGKKWPQQAPQNNDYACVNN